MPADLVTAEQAATTLRKSARTVRRWALEGRLPHALKLPGDTGAFLFHLEDVEALRAELDRAQAS